MWILGLKGLIFHRLFLDNLTYADLNYCLSQFALYLMKTTKNQKTEFALFQTLSRLFLPFASSLM